jgi:glycerol-3-phosphate acyltransferase PlsY
LNSAPAVWAIGVGAAEASTWAAIGVASFLFGSIPFGLVVGRLFYGIDIRKSGSGNIGAANALRTFGKGGALGVLLLDALKGYLPVWLTLRFLSPLDASGGMLPGLREALAGIALGVGAFAGFAALLGHCYSPWLRFRGGKGVATHLGVTFALSWQSGLVFIAAWLLAAIPTGFSSLGSLVATAMTVLSLWYFLGPAALAYGLLAAAIIFWRHRENLARLRAGTENPMGFVKKRTPA